jgi:branched-chain amino acid aminotransferase
VSRDDANRPARRGAKGAGPQAGMTREEGAMLEERTVYLDGRFVPWPQAQVHMMSHGFARGSTIFEVLSLYATPGGPAVFRLRDHAARFFRSAALLDMRLPFAEDDFCTAVAETVRRNRLASGVVKVVGFYPQVALDVMPPDAPLAVAVFALDPGADLKGLGFDFGRGTTVAISRWRKLDPQTVPVEAKAAANYLNGMVARLEARRRGFEDAVMLDTQGFIAEGATESIFLVKAGRLCTPCLGTVLESLTRRSVLEAAAHLGIQAHEGRLRPELLFEAEEIFFVNTPFKVMPVRRIEERELPPIPGPVERRFADFFRALVEGRETRFQEWLTPVA